MTSSSSSSIPNIAFYRLSRELRDFHQANHPNIFLHYQPDYLFHIKALLIGTENTPYENGFYLFTLDFDPKKYPFKPPTVEFKTIHDKVRFHPNFYSTGKVCLSILNTWSGPKWTSCQTLTTILLSLQSLLIEHPLHLEPFFETCNDIRNTTYTQMIEFENINVTLLLYLQKGCPSDHFTPFLEIMKKHFIEKYPSIVGKINTCLDRYPMHQDHTTVVLSSIYRFHSEINYHHLLEKVHRVYEQLTSSPPLPTPDLPPPSSSAAPPKKISREIPARSKNVGDEEFFNNEWYRICEDKIHRKYWKKIQKP